MKGFFIEVTNNLLDPKHRESMGTAVWEFMWCLDKITSIDEDGVGKVLGGRPIKLEEICKEIGGVRRTTMRNLIQLEKHGYIGKRRTPYGIVLWVNKAKKRFGREVTRMSPRSAKNVTSNIRQYKDSNNKNTRDLKNHVIIGSHSKSMEDISREAVDEDGNPRPQKKAKLPKTRKDKLARELQYHFVELCKKQISVVPVIDNAGYFSVLRAMNSGGLTADQVRDLFDEWFKLGRPDEETVSITRALSNRQIEQYKVRNNVR